MLQDHRVLPDHRVRRVCRALRDHRVQPDHGVRRVCRALQVQLVLKEQLVCKA